MRLGREATAAWITIARASEVVDAGELDPEQSEMPAVQSSESWEKLGRWGWRGRRSG